MTQRSHILGNFREQIKHAEEVPFEKRVTNSNKASATLTVGNSWAEEIADYIEELEEVTIGRNEQLARAEARIYQLESVDRQSAARRAWAKADVALVKANRLAEHRKNQLTLADNRIQELEVRALAAEQEAEHDKAAIRSRDAKLADRANHPRRVRIAELESELADTSAALEVAVGSFRAEVERNKALLKKHDQAVQNFGRVNATLQALRRVFGEGGS